MALYISFDGGGTKLNGILFDGEMRLLARGSAGGINLTQTSEADCRANIRAVLKQLTGETDITEAETVYYTGVGDFRILREETEKALKVGRFEGISEPDGGLLAGGLKREGALALSGTGSDVFFITKDKHCAVGGWGPILGDDGSGAWIGQQALRAVVRQMEGWGQETLLLPLLRDEWHLELRRDLVPAIHRAEAPFRKVAAVTPLVGKAAHQGDAVALDILRQAGRLMARQVESLFVKAGMREEDMNITLCGGAWKAHPAMLEAFSEALRRNHPLFEAHRPLFEHVMAGPVDLLLRRGLDREEIQAILENNFPMYRVAG